MKQGEKLMFDSRPLLLLAITHMALISASYSFSTDLPNILDLAAQSIDEATHCYWIDFAVCGETVSAGKLWSFFYNYWTYLFVLPTNAVFSWLVMFSNITPEVQAFELLKMSLVSLSFTVGAVAYIAPILWIVWNFLRCILRIPARIFKKPF